MPKKSDDCGCIEVRASAIHGGGVFASGDIAPRSLIGRYRGRRYSAAEAELVAPAEHVYLFGLSDGSFMDGALGGNATRFINHSCKPNCVAVEVRGARGAVLGVDIHSLEFIAQGQEPFLDYRLDVAESDPATYACQCGHSACRGTMAAVD
jgi:SET domain-containing protein